MKSLAVAITASQYVVKFCPADENGQAFDQGLAFHLHLVSFPIL